MRTSILLIAFLLLALPNVSWAYDVLVLLSTRDAMYEEALDGFRQGRKFKDRTIILSDFAEIDLVRVLKEDRPRVILAIGDKALSMTKRSRQTPVVSLMSLSLNRSGAQPMVTGVDFYAKPDRVFPLFQHLKARKIGVLFDANKSGDYVQKAQVTADRFGIELLKREVASDKDTIRYLTELAYFVDAVWMVPDITAVNSRTLEAYFLVSQGQKIPIVSFDRKHLGLGAALVIEPNRHEMGRQAAEIVTALMDGVPVAELPPTPPRKYQIKSNPNVFKWLNIPHANIERFQSSDRD